MTSSNGWIPERSCLPWLTAPGPGHVRELGTVGPDTVESPVPPPGELAPPRTLTAIPALQEHTPPAGGPQPETSSRQAGGAEPEESATSALVQPSPAVVPDRTSQPTPWPRATPAVNENENENPPPAPVLVAEGAAQTETPLVVGFRRGSGPGLEPSALDVRDLVRVYRVPPSRGWRKVAFTTTRGRWNPGLSASEVERGQLIAQVRTQLPGTHRVVICSAKGGVGKTTATAGLALTLAEYRGDRVVAMDANPDAGTLADRLTGHCGVTVRELIENLDAVRTWTDMAHYTSLAGRLQVLASEQDPAMSEAFSREEYQAVSALLSRFYNVVLTDSGTGLVHSAMGGALDAAETLVIVGAPTLDGASRASKTLDWLVAHGYRDLVEHAVVALSCDRASRDVDRTRIVDYFQSRCRTVVTIPADPHLAVGGVIQLDALHQRTRDAFLRLGAAVAEQFSWNHTSALPVGQAQ